MMSFHMAQFAGKVIKYKNKSYIALIHQFHNLISKSVLGISIHAQFCNDSGHAVLKVPSFCSTILYEVVCITMLR
jgi:hypothetical protein